MHERYFSPITLNELAAEVYVSPFHFSRMFSKITGVTPGRYLTAIRLFEAKRLLLNTSLTVSDVVCSVGYSSVGTFTSRFTRAVGITPTQYRDPEVKELLLAFSPRFKRIPSFRVLRDAGVTCARPQEGGGALVGNIIMPKGAAPANVLIGLFHEPIPQRGPVAFKGIPNTGSTEMIINNIPPGTWTVIAAAEHPDATTPEESFSLGFVRTPVTVTSDETVSVNLRMRPMRPTDPPIAITLASTVMPTAGRNRMRQVVEHPQAA
jgi:AraC-like DNA-binding protein